MQEANATYDKLLDAEQANRGKQAPAAATGSTLSIDKIIMGEIPVFELGEASAFFDEADPEVAQKLSDMRTGLGSHLQSGFAKFVQEHKEQ